MKRLTEIAQDRIAEILFPGAIAIDATAGNGHDTLFLAQCVGPSGWVYGCDLQAIAIARTEDLLESHAVQNVKLLEGSHAEITDHLEAEHRQNIQACMFNLGYLPRGDKRVMTVPDSTCVAIRSILPQLAVGGVMTIIGYRGHPGGVEETAAVEGLLSDSSQSGYEMEIISPPQEHAPRLFVVERVGTI